MTSFSMTIEEDAGGALLALDLSIERERERERAAGFFEYPFRSLTTRHEVLHVEKCNVPGGTLGGPRVKERQC